MNDIDNAYKSIGEFVVVFQWIENTYREIGWFILDPEHRNWPPRQLRTESNRDLIDKVTSLFVDLTVKYAFPNGPERAEDFRALSAEFHAFRKYRNRLLHSTFVELKAGGELVGLLRSDPKLEVDSDTGEIIYDQEHFSHEVVYAKLHEIAEAAYRLGNHLVQLRHWHPFERFPQGA